MNKYVNDIIFSVIQYRYLFYMLVFQTVFFAFIFFLIGKMPIYRVGITYFWMFLHAIIIFIPLHSLYKIIRYMLAGKTQPTLLLFKYYYSKIIDGKFISHFFMTAIVFLSTIVIFASIKSSIPILIPFWADPYFVEIDRFLFFGTLPHEIIEFVYELDFAIVAINFFYHLWNILIVLFMFFTSLTSNNKLRFQILHVSIISWFVAGNWMAILLASVGPVYYEYFFNGSTIYLPLMDQLEMVNERTGMVWALNAQHLLLESYINTESPISGISAMPSMHVVFAFIIAFAAMELSRIVAVAGYLFAFLILIGSVVLGWHYAVDGIFGIFIAIIFWRISHPITRRVIEGEKQNGNFGLRHFFKLP